MPLVKEIAVNAGTRLGIWEINEDADQLKWQLQWGQEDIKKFSSYGDPLRSMHWLASRVLIRKMLNTPKFIDIDEDEFGKPFIVNFPYIMSISHSGKMVAVMLSHDNCGMDIQLIDQKIFKVANKFMSEEERESMDEEFQIEQYHVFWSAKEAMYKFYGKKKLEFSRDLVIYPFHYSDQGKLRGRIEKEDYNKELNIAYKKMGDYILAYTVG